MGSLHSSFFTWFGNIACYRYKVFNKALKRIQDDSQVSEICFLSISALHFCIDYRFLIPYRVISCPSMDLLKVFTYMCCLCISNGLLSCCIPLPIDGSDIHRAHQRLPDGIHTMLYKSALGLPSNGAF